MRVQLVRYAQGALIRQYNCQYSHMRRGEEARQAKLKVNADRKAGRKYKLPRSDDAETERKPDHIAQLTGSDTQFHTAEVVWKPDYVSQLLESLPEVHKEEVVEAMPDHVAQLTGRTPSVRRTRRQALRLRLADLITSCKVLDERERQERTPVEASA